MYQYLSLLSLVRRKKVALLALQKGRLVCRAKPNVPLVRWQKFNFFVRWRVLFFLGSACVSPSWSAGLFRDTANLSAVLRSSKKSGQDVKGRWFNCLVDGCWVSSVRLACNRVRQGNFTLTFPQNRT